jgi:hypothetical protein
MKINPAGARVINNPAALRAGSSTQINSIFRPANKIRGPVCGRNNALLYHRSGGERYGRAITSRWIHRMAGNYCKCGRARLELPRGNQIAQRAHTKRRAVHLTHWWLVIAAAHENISERELTDRPTVNDVWFGTTPVRLTPAERWVRGRVTHTRWNLPALSSSPIQERERERASTLHKK